MVQAAAIDLCLHCLSEKKNVDTICGKTTALIYDFELRIRS